LTESLADIILKLNFLVDKFIKDIDIPIMPLHILTIPIISIIFGLILLVWSADRFVDGSAAAAKKLGMSPLLIGMIVVGFGTSAPEMIVSATASLGGNAGIALGNAYGSNIANIAFILGVTALISPVIISKSILRKELPILTLVTLISIALLWDGDISRIDAGILIVVFSAFMAYAIASSIRGSKASLTKSKEIQAEGANELDSIPDMSIGKACLWLIIGLILLIISSHMLVSGAVSLARHFGLNDIIIGLTIVALGTSLPELASSISAARKGQNDIALGNVLGSNLFNTLAVVGIAGCISPLEVDKSLLYRDIPIMLALTLLLFFFGWSRKGKPAGIGRIYGVILIAIYLAYSAYLVCISL